MLSALASTVVSLACGVPLLRLGKESCSMNSQPQIFSLNYDTPSGLKQDLGKSTGCSRTWV